MLAFADNHDVSRVSSILKEQRHLPLLYALLFTIPGIPCIYYGSEWGISGIKENNSDDALRLEISAPEWNDLTTLIASLAAVHKQYKSLLYGDYKSIVLTNRQLVFQREFEGERIWVALNADSQAYYAQLNGMGAGNAVKFTEWRMCLALRGLFASAVRSFPLEDLAGMHPFPVCEDICHSHEPGLPAREGALRRNQRNYRLSGKPSQSSPFPRRAEACFCGPSRHRLNQCGIAIEKPWNISVAKIAKES